MDLEDHSMVYRKTLGPYIVEFYYGAHGPCMLSQATILALHMENLAQEWDMLLILNFRTIGMVLGAYDSVWDKG